MKKVKQAICIAALAGSLASPAAWADDSADGGQGILDALLAQLEALWLGESNPPVDDLGAAMAEGPGNQPELGPVALPNG